MAAISLIRSQLHGMRDQSLKHRETEKHQVLEITRQLNELQGRGQVKIKLNPCGKIRKRRRACLNLKVDERWYCPNSGCTKFYRKTSTHGIQNHFAQCKFGVAKEKCRMKQRKSSIKHSCNKNIIKNFITQKPGLQITCPKFNMLKIRLNPRAHKVQAQTIMRLKVRLHAQRPTKKKCSRKMNKSMIVLNSLFQSKKIGMLESKNFVDDMTDVNEEDLLQQPSMKMKKLMSPMLTPNFSKVVSPLATPTFCGNAMPKDDLHPILGVGYPDLLKNMPRSSPNNNLDIPENSRGSDPTPPKVPTTEIYSAEKETRVKNMMENAAQFMQMTPGGGATALFALPDSKKFQLPTLKLDPNGGVIISENGTLNSLKRSPHFEQVPIFDALNDNTESNKSLQDVRIPMLCPGRNTRTPKMGVSPFQESAVFLNHIADDWIDCI